jgi:hypothetical protein
MSDLRVHVFDETFGVNRAFNAEVFVAPPHAVAMEFDLFGERRSSHWVNGGGVSKRELLGLAHVSSPFGRGWVRVRKLESQNRRPDPGAGFLGKRVDPSKAYDPDAPEFKPE